MRVRSSRGATRDLERWWRRTERRVTAEVHAERAEAAYADVVAFRAEQDAAQARLASRAARPKPVLQDGWVEHERWYNAALLLP
jgi:hypothetical protein